MSRHNRQRWVVATRNAGKLAEFRALLGTLPFELVALADVAAADSPVENASTFIENALIKARAATLSTGMPAIADDSGLVVPALGGAPGIRSARFAGPEARDEDNTALLLERMRAFDGVSRSAHFVCVVVALLAPDDPLPAIAVGRWTGSIARAARGEKGFGYDPVFVDAATGRTAAELGAAEKNARSHRGAAVAALARLLGEAVTADRPE